MTPSDQMSTSAKAKGQRLAGGRKRKRLTFS